MTLAATIADTLKVLPSRGHGYFTSTTTTIEDDMTEVDAVVIDATFTVPELRQVARAIICHTEKGCHLPVEPVAEVGSMAVIGIFAGALSGFVMGVVVTALVFIL